MDNYRIPSLARCAAETERERDNEKRLIRIETRLTKLMRHFGLRNDGTPITETTFTDERIYK